MSLLHRLRISWEPPCWSHWGSGWISANVLGKSGRVLCWLGERPAGASLLFVLQVFCSLCDYHVECLL